MFIIHCLIVTALCCLSTLAYIPASPTNDTARAVREGTLPVNPSDTSTLNLRWFPNGTNVIDVSYQLAGYESTGLNKGVLLRFSEDNVSDSSPPTLTPWIALVNCDRNATNMSMEVDIFTLARDKGAVAAVLYSLKYEACIINPEYADPSTFDQVFDIFSTKSLINSAIIDYQYGQLSTPNRSLYSSYDSKRLNDSAEVIEESIATNTARGSNFLFATLLAYNATVADTALPANGTSTSGQDNRRSTGTNSAMIVLYSITGCVSALFVAVIITGAIRAIRHPERYGPRATDAGGGFMPAHARGLTRAIVDTFPIFKFSSSRSPDATAQKDVESGDGGNSVREAHGRSMNLEMADWVAIDAKLQKEEESEHSSKRDSHPTETSASPPGEPGPSSLMRRDTSRAPKPANEEVMPDAIGRQTCPICIVDFEEGDDLRMLPCEGKHIFHQQCVDPWLLELSSSCPLCRHDFMALESMLSGESRPDNGAGWRPQSSTTNDPRHSGANRFSRYLRSARHRRNRQQDQEDPTDPYDLPPPTAI